MEMKDSLPSFGLYSRQGDALEFKRPSLSLAVKDGAEVASQDRLRQGMDSSSTALMRSLRWPSV